jgi:hypothetical protein
VIMFRTDVIASPRKKKPVVAPYAREHTSPTKRSGQNLSLQTHSPAQSHSPAQYTAVSGWQRVY